VTGLVLDCSVAVAWLLDDEASGAPLAVADQVAGQGAFVPSLWVYEVANALATAVRRRRLGRDELARAAHLLSALPIRVVDGPGLHGIGSLTLLACDHAVSAYDAEYLRLAIALELPLATLDAKLRSAAISAGVDVLPNEG